ncbi:LamG domain-containing protein [Seleniivibrio woodruffii]|uniref:Concanavalin A-like lectin/glucanase superfamily protein n=1 Tax=Seleniivibrio woodruffii TaxID=1078050 RepID=A0A4R1K2D7_9BACT|nr:LamG domain-containing protein [Seleniivibrio woodruffii]TCK58188.1 concanavalin A-like lectin/glucanase superfamily protein [Seleniivibrio woodruffii]TVZ35653.1 concanavalin A-like lectin/glucanase superfamily protein [Seleniivibrio woodruffii]
MSYKDVRQILSSVFDSEDSALRATLKTEGELLNMVLDETGEAPALRVRLVDFQPVTSIIDGEAAVYADLPNPAEHMNEIYIVTTASGIPLVSRKQAGMYRSDGISWNLLDTDLQADKVYYSGTVHAGNVQDALETLKLMSDVNSSSVAAHSSNASNPHGVTKAQIGLGNVDNTADAAKPVSAAVQTALDTKMTASAYTGAFGNLDSPLLHLPLKKNLLTAQGQSVCTFTRASAATYVDRYGMLKSVAADIPRFTADGLLIEGTSTNLLTYSEQFENGAWVKTNTSITTNTAAVTDPFGTNLAEKLYDDASNGEHYIYQQSAYTNGTTYCLSVFAQSAERTQLKIYSSGGAKGALFDLSNGLILSCDSGVTASIKKLSNGWFRCSIVFTAIVTATRANYFYSTVLGNTSYVGDGTSGLYIFGAQLEAMPFATSYIPTTTASATRVANYCQVSQTDNIPSYSKDFTISTDIVPLGIAGTQYIMGDANLSTGLKLYIETDGVIYATLGGVSLKASIFVSATVTYRVCLIKKGTLIYFYVNGDLKESKSVSNPPANQANLFIGSRNGTSGNGYVYISNLRIYDRALTAEEVRLA